MIHLQRDFFYDFKIGSSVGKTLNGKGTLKYLDHQHPLSVRGIKDHFIDPHPLL